MSASGTFTIKQGDTHRQLQLTLTEITTTGASGVVFRMRLRGGTTRKIDDAAGAIDSATQVSYQFTAGDIDTPGIYEMECRLTFGDGPEKVPTVGFLLVEVTPEIP